MPARLFWSATVDDNETRSQILTAQDKAALRSLFELKDLGDAKAVDLYIGPKAPASQESRWIQTTPGKGWFTYFRIYGPEGRRSTAPGGRATLRRSGSDQYAPLSLRAAVAQQRAAH